MNLDQTDCIAKEVIAKIKYIRLKKNYKQAYMAARMGCSQNAYSKIEIGRTELTFKSILKIAVILDISLVGLLSEVINECDNAFIPEFAEAMSADQ